jgi:hypothetical protein
VDLRKKIELALQRSLKPERIDLKDNGGIYGYIVSPQFRRMEPLDRQTLLTNALHAPAAKLTREDLRRVLAIAALTPEEYVSYQEEQTVPAVKPPRSRLADDD